jgi:hypothetical protein
MVSLAQVPATATLRRIHQIQAITIVWMIVEASVSLSAAWMARSPVLLAFGGDSAIELLSAEWHAATRPTGAAPSAVPTADQHHLSRLSSIAQARLCASTEPASPCRCEWN